MKRRTQLLFLFLILTCILQGEKKPNVLFIAIDDLNDWVGCLGGHPHAKTPNLDRLAASGILFNNAHCPAPACNPSRSAVFTGISPHVSGLYRNEQKMRDVLPNAELLPLTFSKAGYWSGGSGKMLHYIIDVPSWDEYFPPKKTDNPFPRTLAPPQRPLSLARAGSWQYYETDWGPIHSTDQEYGGDYSVAQWVGEKLSRQWNQPFFLACGIYRPHEPWFVPQKYFDLFPIEEIELPPGYLENDLADLPGSGARLARNRYFPHIREQKQWKHGIQGYLASISFADAMLGRVLDALEEGPNAKDTIVVLWSDHGWHLGEKEHWQKFTLWRACTRVPLIIRVPEQTLGLVAGTKSALCSKPVNLLSLAPTLLQLCGIEPSSKHDGPSLVPLLHNTNAKWNHVSITHLQNPGSFGLSDEKWRYIKYTNGDEELYNIQNDPFEWKNLASKQTFANVLDQLRKKAPTNFAKLVKPTLENHTSLEWHSLEENIKAPSSNPSGNSFDVIFINQGGRKVELFWIDREGAKKPYAQIKPGESKVQRTRLGAVWMIADATLSKRNKPLGYFKIDHRDSKALIPYF